MTQQNRQQRNQPKNNVLAVGDMVVVARRFFKNHGLAVHDLGICKLASISASFALIELEYHPVLFIYQSKNLIKVFRGVNSNATIQIHPVYLEKVIVKHGKKKQN